MKRIVTLLLAIALTLAMAPRAKAAGAVTGTCGETITWVLEDGTLTLSGSGTVNVTNFDYPPWEDHYKEITAIVVEEGITCLGRVSFIALPNLERVSLQESLTTIGSQVFQGCDRLEEITIPKNVAYIGDVQGSPATVFSGDSMQNIHVDPENRRFYSVDGVLFDRYTNALICYPMGRTADSYTVPEGIQEITYGALWFFQGSSLNLPQSLQTIHDSAFCAAGFTSLELPEGLRSIGSMAFVNCDQLTEITIPASVQRIEAQGFASCEMLDTITILNPDCQLAPSGDTLSSNSKIRGFLNSTAQTYARNYGRNFIDMETEKLYAYDYGNAAYISLLPTETGGSAPAFNIWSMEDESGRVMGFQPELAVELDKTNPDYQEMLAFVTELTKYCTNDYTKARTVCQWVNSNMTYVFGLWGTATTAEGVYKLWDSRRGNCMGYTQLNNFLLYLLDIPTATVTSYGHCWSAALINGEWIMIDATNNIFDAPPNNFEDIQTIFFGVNDNLVCVINDLTGVKLASYGISIYDHALVSEITIPSYIVYIYDSVFFLEDCYQSVTTHLTIKGEAGTYAETYLRENLPHYNHYTYENGMFTAKVGKPWTEDDAIYLLKGVLFPELYPISGDMDFTRDDQITEDDAIYLLRHVLFPELYPL